MTTRGFPEARGRRLRATPALREAFAETSVTPGQLVQPIFVIAGSGARSEITSMPGQYRMSADVAADEAKALEAAGVGGVILFGIPDSKDAVGSGASDPSGPVCSAIDTIRNATSELTVWADVCLCEYTDHGHCGLVDDNTHTILNDASLPHLSRAAVTYADAGAHVVAPSDMMDGRVGAVRSGLDAAGHESVVIVSYAAKYASAFYGPFRDAAESVPSFGDRRTYQMDPRNADEAFREVELDVAEGADVVMVKPAGPYLDVVRRVADAVDTVGVPVAAYQVSGEFAMISAAAGHGWLDRRRAVDESLTGIRRAGAQVVLTYFAREFAEGETP